MGTWVWVGAAGAAGYSMDGRMDGRMDGCTAKRMHPIEPTMRGRVRMRSERHATETSRIRGRLWVGCIIRHLGMSQGQGWAWRGEEIPRLQASLSLLRGIVGRREHTGAYPFKIIPEPGSVLVGVSHSPAFSHFTRSSNVPLRASRMLRRRRLPTLPSPKPYGSPCNAASPHNNPLRLSGQRRARLAHGAQGFRDYRTSLSLS